METRLLCIRIQYSPSSEFRNELFISLILEIFSKVMKHFRTSLLEVTDMLCVRFTLNC